MLGQNVSEGLKLGKLLCRLAGRPYPAGEPEPVLWQGAELPAALWEYHHYLYPPEGDAFPFAETGAAEEPHGIPLEDAVLEEPPYALRTLLDPEDCYSFHAALEGECESAAEYFAELQSAEALTGEESQWLAQYPALRSQLEAALRGEDYLIFAESRSWYAGIRMEQLGELDPPVWLSCRWQPTEWQRLTGTTEEFCGILLLEELSGGESGGRRYHRTPAAPELLAALPDPPEGAGPFLCWLEEPGCLLFRMWEGGRLRGLRIDREHTFRSDDSWQSGYLLQHHLRGQPGQERSRVEPFSLAGCCEQRGLPRLARALRGEDVPLLTLEPFADPESVREFTRMDTALHDITALAACTRLKELRLPRNRITDLSPLRGLVNLRDLSVPDNGIHSLEPLAGLTALGYLNLSGNPIASAELEHLRKLKRLKSLLLNDTQVDDLAALQGFRGYSLELTGLSVLKNAEVLKTRTRLQSLRLDLQTERAQRIGELVPWLNIRVEYNGVVELTSKAYYE